MAIELNEISTPAQTELKGRGVYTLTAGQVFKIECNEDVLDESVPEGKAWRVTITINIDETDA